nr:hypothetical protein [uncultured Dyadobacter sp.]
MSAVDKFPQLDHLTERHFVVEVEAGSFNKLIVRLIGQVENLAVDIDAVDEPTEIQEIVDFKRSLYFAKMKNNPGG